MKCFKIADYRKFVVALCVCVFVICNISIEKNDVLERICFGNKF